MKKKNAMKILIIFSTVILIFSTFTSGAGVSVSAYEDQDNSEVDYIEISPENETGSAGDDVWYYATAYDENDDKIGDVTSETNWSIDDDAGGWWIGDDGNVYIMENAGEWTVKASYEYDGEYFNKTTNLIVDPGEANYIEIEPADSNVTAGETIDYTAIVYDEFGNGVEEVTEETNWSIDEEAGGEWDQETGEYTAEFKGEWTVKGEYDPEELESMSDEADLEVNPAEIEYIEIEPENATITAGFRVNYHARAYDEFGNEVGCVTEEASWSIDEEAGGTWDQKNAIYRSEVAGEWVVKAEYNGKTDSTNLEVQPGGVAHIEISPKEDQTIEVGETIDFSAEAYDRFNNLITDRDKDFTWENTTEEGIFEITEPGEYQVTAYSQCVTSEPTTVTVKEEEIFYNLTIQIEGDGNTEPSEGNYTYEESEEVTVEATPAEGWEFVQWTGDITGTETTIDITMDSDFEITAVFEEEPPEKYDLTINIEGEGTTDPEEGTHTYEEGTEVPVEAAPAEGWEFVQWTGDETGTVEEITITMDEDKEITAVFEELDPAFFEVNITAYDEEVKEGETVMVEFTVKNTGELEDMQDIVFSVDGEDKKGEPDVELDAGEEFSGQFTWNAEDGGEYELRVASEDDEDTVIVTVEEEEDDPLIPIPGFTTLILVLGSVLAVAIYHKKEL